VAHTSTDRGRRSTLPGSMSRVSGRSSPRPLSPMSCQPALTTRHPSTKVDAMVDDPATAAAGDDPAAAATSEDPITGLRAVHSLRELAERLETLQVARARQLGLSWQEIADALGVTRQAVHKKHRKEL